ncbi:unnamed protein product, partial [Brenthis ino]
MDNTSMSIEDMETIEIAKYAIEKELSDLKKIVDHLCEMRVQAFDLECNVMTKVDSKTWTNISELIGLSRSLLLSEGEITFS